MHKTIRAKGRGLAYLLGTPLGALAFLVLLAVVSAATVGALRAGSRAVTGSGDAAAARPADATVLQVQATRSERGAGANASIRVEAWLDEVTNEGKIVETAPDGTLRRIESLSAGTYVLYLGDARHAVIRRGIGPTSPYATRIRTQLFLYRTATERGTGQVVGNGRIGEQPTDRIQLANESAPVVADVDQTTGLALREELGQPGGARQTRETMYNRVAHVSRGSLPPGAFEVELPAGLGREEYTEGPAGNARTSPAGLPYAVYAAPASAGAPVAAFQRASTMPGGPSSNTYYLIYQTRDGEVSVMSSLPPDLARQEGKGQAPDSQSQSTQVGGASWEVRPTSRGFQGSAHLADAYVTVHAPNQAVFERVVTSLQRLNP